jgi:hypothetical protein
MMAGDVTAMQAIWALAALLLFGVVGRFHLRYTRRGERLAMLMSLYVIGLAYSAHTDQLSARIGGFLMGGAAVWIGATRSSQAGRESTAVAVRGLDPDVRPPEPNSPSPFPRPPDPIDTPPYA